MTAIIVIKSFTALVSSEVIYPEYKMNLYAQIKNVFPLDESSWGILKATSVYIMNLRSQKGIYDKKLNNSFYNLTFF